MNKSARCRCCLSRPPDKRDGIQRLYGTMLKECFNIELRYGVVSGDAGICNMCIKQLDDALDFKTQVLQCQLYFEANVNTALKDETPTIKTETEDVNDDDHNDVSAEFKPESDMSDEDDKTLLDIKQETDSCGNKELTVKLLKPAPASNKPVPAMMKPILARNRPVPAKMKPVPAKMKPVPDKMKPVPARKKPVLAKMKPVPDKMKPVPAKMKPVLDKMKPVPDKKQPLLARAVGEHDKYRVTQLTENVRLHMDATLLFRYSTATPFQHKTVAGAHCLFCCETLPTMAALREHTHNKHENNKVPIKHKNVMYLKMDILDLQCKLCHTDLDLISTLKKHLTEKHNILFKSLKDYILEFKLTDAETMNCARCDSTFETFKTLQQHMNTHYKNCICEVCAAGFINARFMKMHLKTHETGSHKCSQCDKVFNYKDKLTLHEKTHQTTRKRKMRKCPHCGGMFGNYYKRNRHMVEVHKVAAATYKCKVCDRDFYLKADMTMHIKKVHLMERNHKCQLCDKEFFDNVMLKKHMITHDGADKAYQCAVCQKAYARKYTLSEHMRIHNNDRRFQCGECGVKFVQKCSLKGHMMSSHGLTLADCDSEGGVYTCKSS